MISTLMYPNRRFFWWPAKLLLIGLFFLCASPLLATPSAKAAELPAALAADVTADQPVTWVTIGSRLWLEDDHDGNAATGTVVSVGAGHLVRAKASNGIVYTGVTDAKGNYAIAVPAFDTYIVTVDPIPGYSDSPVLVTDGANPAGNENLNHQRTGTTVVMTDVNNLSIDFGFYHHVKMVQLGDRLWFEDDNDGNASTGTVTPVGPGHVVTAVASDKVTTYTGVTDANGFYLIPVPEYDTYWVTTAIPTGAGDTPVWTKYGYQPSQYNDKNHDRNGTTVTMSDQDNLSIDFGFTRPVQPPLVSLGNYVWLDGDKDGTQNEPPSAGRDGITVTLTTSNGGISSTVTSGGGYYYFTNLQPHQVYTVHFTLPAGYSFTTLNQGNDGVDSDAPTSGTVVVSLGAQDEFTIDAGLVLVPPALVALGDRVWVDANRDGQQNDAHDPIVAGLTVTLLNPQGQAVGSTTTNATGYYSFTDLLPGDYVVAVQLPAGYGVTSGGIDPDVDSSNTDSNALADGTRMVSQAITLAVNTEPLNDNLAQAGNDASGNGTVDFGLVKLASLGDFVWEDSNNNGRQETGEPPIANVAVTLTGADGSTATTTTNANGIYTFTNLLPGLPYTVTFTTPAGFTPTLANNTGDDTTDSDGLVVSVPPLQPGQHNPTFDSGFVRLLPTLQLPELRLSKQVMTAPGLIQPGAVVTYSLRYTNVGSGPAVGVIISETVSTHTKFFARASRNGWGCADGATAGTLCRFTVGDLQPGQSGEVIFAVKIDLGVTAGTNIVNAAVISFQNVAGVSAQATSTVVGPTNLPVTPEPGQNHQRLFLPLVTR